MDEIKLTANQRFDLLDMTRLKSYIQEAFAQLMVGAMGDYYHFNAISGYDRLDAPFIGLQFLAQAGTTPSLVFTVKRVWTGLYSKQYAAIVFDKDGYRVGGPNSATSKQLTVAATPGSTTRYLMIRRVITDDTPEPRKFYDSTTGKYTTTVNTRSIDDYEIQENVNSARSNAALRDAGWIDIAEFQTNGTDDINSVTAVNGSIMFRDILTWSLGTTYPDQATYGGYDSIPNMISALRQMVGLLRGDSDTFDDTSNHAEFESEGGFRFGSGDTADTGKQSRYLRSLGAAKVVSPCSVSLPTIMAHLASLGANGVFAAVPSGSAQGYRYAASPGTETPTIVDKFYVVNPIQYHPNQWTKDPYDVVPGSDYNYWFMNEPTGPRISRLLWELRYDALISDGRFLLIPLSVLYDSRFSEIAVTVTTVQAFSANVDMVTTFYKQDLTDNSITTLEAKTFNTGNGGIFTTPGTTQITVFDGSTDGYETNDTENYLYGLGIQIQDDGVVGGFTDYPQIRIGPTRITTQIREASHVY